jgi:flagellar hook assembly protein FlgD
LDLAAGVFTPNGDGINDAMDISYDLLKLVTPRPVVVEIRDLAGRLVREVYSGLDAAGRHVREWDGLDAQGQQVNPGIYICRIEVETEEGRQQRSGVVSVVY